MEKETEDCQHEYLAHPIQSMYSTKRTKATFPTTILSLQWDEFSRLEHIGISRVTAELVPGPHGRRK